MLNCKYKVRVERVRSESFYHLIESCIYSRSMECLLGHVMGISGLFLLQPSCSGDRGCRFAQGLLLSVVVSFAWLLQWFRVYTLYMCNVHVIQAHYSCTEYGMFIGPCYTSSFFLYGVWNVYTNIIPYLVCVHSCPLFVFKHYSILRTRIMLV